MTRLTRRGSEQESLGLLLREYRGHKTQLDELKKRVEEVKARLMAHVERSGAADEKGSLWVEFDEPVEGYSALKRERRSKVLLDEERAEKRLRSLGLYDECTNGVITVDGSVLDEVLKMFREEDVPVVSYTQTIDDDKILQIYFAEKQEAERVGREPVLTEADIDAMFREEISWAFVPKQA